MYIIQVPGDHFCMLTLYMKIKLHKIVVQAETAPATFTELQKVTITKNAIVRGLYATHTHHVHTHTHTHLAHTHTHHVHTHTSKKKNTPQPSLNHQI